MTNWQQIGAWLLVLTPLVGVPLTAITFYLRAVREQSTGRIAELAQRVDRLDTLADSTRQRIADVERDFTTKEEWVREIMLARAERRKLHETVVRLESRNSMAGQAAAWTNRIDQAAQASLAASERLERMCNQLSEAAVTPPAPTEVQG